MEFQADGPKTHQPEFQWAINWLGTAWGHLSAQWGPGQCPGGGPGGCLGATPWWGGVLWALRPRPKMILRFQEPYLSSHEIPLHIPIYM